MARRLFIGLLARRSGGLGAGADVQRRLIQVAGERFSEAVERAVQAAADDAAERHAAEWVRRAASGLKRRNGRDGVGRR